MFKRNPFISALLLMFVVSFQAQADGLWKDKSFLSFYGFQEFADSKRWNPPYLVKRWEAMADSCEPRTMEELMPLFLKLKSVKSEEIFGTWRGGKFDGCLPDPINWWGKLLESREYAEPLLVTAADGSIQIFTALGSARMREVFFENRTSAALIYEERPIIDYFRQVNDDLIIGYGEVKGEGVKNDLFFWLRRTDDLEF